MCCILCGFLCGMMRITSLAFLDIIMVDVRQGNSPRESLAQSLCQCLVCGSVKRTARHRCGEFWYWHSVVQMSGYHDVVLLGLV